SGSDAGYSVKSLPSSRGNPSISVVRISVTRNTMAKARDSQRRNRKANALGLLSPPLARPSERVGAVMSVGLPEAAHHADAEVVDAERDDEQEQPDREQRVVLQRPHPRVAER